MCHYIEFQVEPVLARGSSRRGEQESGHVEEARVADDHAPGSPTLLDTSIHKLASRRKRLG